MKNLYILFLLLALAATAADGSTRHGRMIDESDALVNHPAVVTPTR